MAIIYRTVFEVDRAQEADWPDFATRTFSEWLEAKRRAAERHGQTFPASLEVPPSSGELQEEGWTLRRVEGANDDVRALRLTLAQENESGERWATEMTTWTGSGPTWVWIDLSRVADDPYERSVPLSIPDLTRRFLEGDSCLNHGWPLSATPWEVPRSRVSHLIEHLFDSARLLPVIVVTQPRDEALFATRIRAGELQRRVIGVANVTVLHAEAQAAFEARTGNDLKVWGGAIRTYLPDIDPTDPRPWRHRYVRWFDLKDWDARALDRWALPLVRQATALRPPEEYRTHVHALLRPTPSDARSAEALLEELIAAEAEIERLKDEQTNLAEGNRALLDERDELDRVRDDLQRRLDWYVRLAEQPYAPEPGPDNELEVADTPPATCEDAVYTYLTLDFVDMLDPDGVAEGAAELDSDIHRRGWAKQIWRSLRELDQYAAAKRKPAADRFQGDFGMWLTSAGGAGTTFARTESEGLRNNDRLRSQRAFPVPTEVHKDGRIDMLSHIKIGSGKPPAPRLHFYDDSGGATGKIWVGYIGAHLDTMRTN